MSPEAILSILARLNILLEEKYNEHIQKIKKFKILQMTLIVISSSISLVLFVIYHAPILQMLFVLVGFNFLFYIGFKHRTHYDKKAVKTKVLKDINSRIKS